MYTQLSQIYVKGMQELEMSGQKSREAYQTLQNVRCLAESAHFEEWAQKNKKKAEEYRLAYMRAQHAHQSGYTYMAMPDPRCFGYMPITWPSFTFCHTMNQSPNLVMFFGQLLRGSLVQLTKFIFRLK
jgi:hypothetical protein